MALFGHKGELVVPPAAKADGEAVELARIWASGGAQHVVLRADFWDDPAAWGLMLVDLARHISRAYAQAQGRDQQETMQRIRAGFDAEWTSPTDDPTGAIE